MLLDKRQKQIKLSVIKSPLSKGQIQEAFIARGTSLDKVNKALTIVGKPNITEENLQDHVVRFVASDATPDRWGDIINPKGWDLKEYRKNPVFLLQHNSRSHPIGISLKEIVKKESTTEDIHKDLQGQLEMDVFFHGLTKESIDTLALYKAGMMKAVSVGFVPIEIRQLQDDKERLELGLGPYGELFERQQLLELSAVTLPANPNAVMVEDKANKIANDAINQEALVEKVLSKLIPMFEDKFATPTEIEQVSKSIKTIEGKINLITNRNSAKHIINSRSLEDDSDDKSDGLSDKDILTFLNSSFQNSPREG